MGHDVLGNLLDAILAADDHLQLCPARLQFLAALDLLALGDLFKLRVDTGFLLLVEGQLGQAALVEDRGPWPCPPRPAVCRRC